MARINGEAMDNDELTAFARIGAELEYANLMRKQAAIRKMFPGIAAKAQLRVQQEQAAHARQFRKRTRRPKAETPPVALADRG